MRKASNNFKKFGQGKKMDAYDSITNDDLTDDLRLLTEICGIDATKKLMRNYAGMSFYIPKLSRLDNFVPRYLKNNSDKSLKVIAKQLNCSEQFLKTMIKKNGV